MHDARLFAVAAATAWYLWRGGILGTIVSGMVVLVPLKLMLGWQGKRAVPCNALVPPARSACLESRVCTMPTAPS